MNINCICQTKSESKIYNILKVVSVEEDETFIAEQREKERKLKVDR